MATRRTVFRVFAMLKAAYPEWARNLSDTEEDATLKLYVDRLQSIPDDMLEETALAWVDRERFFPRIADLKDAIRKAQASYLLTPDQAWAACLAGTTTEESLAFRVFGNLGFNLHDIPRMDYGTVNVMQSNYMRAYREALTQEQHRAALPPALQQALPATEAIRKLPAQDAPEEQEAGIVPKEQAQAELRAIYERIAELRREQAVEPPPGTEQENERREALRRQAQRLRETERG